RELEVAPKAEQLRLGARAAALRARGHRVPHAPVQVAHELFEDLLLAREVEIERALRDSGGFGDLHDRRLVVAELGEDVLRGFEQASASRRAATRELLPVHAGRQRGRELTHAGTSGVSRARNSSFSTL